MPEAKEAVCSAWRLLEYCQLPDKKLPHYVEECSELFAVFQDICVFVARFFAERLVFCDTLAGKH
jgi:hypothetical protein